jgi:hypothetical protein
MLLLLRLVDQGSQSLLVLSLEFFIAVVTFRGKLARYSACSIGEKLAPFHVA